MILLDSTQNLSLYLSTYTNNKSIPIISQYQYTMCLHYHPNHLSCHFQKTLKWTTPRSHCASVLLLILPFATYFLLTLYLPKCNSSPVSKWNSICYFSTYSSSWSTSFRVIWQLSSLSANLPISNVIKITYTIRYYYYAMIMVVAMWTNRHRFYTSNC